MERARKQQRIVEELTSNDASVWYDFQLDSIKNGTEPCPFPDNATILAHVLGIDFFHNVEWVVLGRTDVVRSLSVAWPVENRELEIADVEKLKALPRLKHVTIFKLVSFEDVRLISECKNIKKLILASYIGDANTLTTVSPQRPDLEISVIY